MTYWKNSESCLAGYIRCDVVFVLWLPVLPLLLLLPTLRGGQQLGFAQVVAITVRVPSMVEYGILERYKPASALFITFRLTSF